MLKNSLENKEEKKFIHLQQLYIFLKSSLNILVHWSIFERDGKVVFCVHCAKNALKIHHSPAICLGRQSSADEKTQRKTAVVHVKMLFVCGLCFTSSHCFLDAHECPCTRQAYISRTKFCILSSKNLNQHQLYPFTGQYVPCYLSGKTRAWKISTCFIWEYTPHMTDNAGITEDVISVHWQYRCAVSGEGGIFGLM